MENMAGRLGNATPTTSLHQLHWWKSPRWIVIRIEALAVVAIIFSFFLAAFGSCRRWSNSWIVQKGFFAAQVLSLSLGTYSIGLMQSSSVKSEMYPLWTVSLFTLFGCIDPVTTYNGLDYKGPLSKVVYGICLNWGYVLLISISTVSNVIGNTAIITLSAITFIKGFHRSFALVQQNRMRDMLYTLDDSYGETSVINKDEHTIYDWRNLNMVDLDTKVYQGDIEKSIRNNNDERLRSCYDVCVALCLSHMLQHHILGLDYRVPIPGNLKGIDFKWALKVIEIELAFVYDAFFTGNPFLHYYQAKTSSLWALASFTGICFVLVATATPGGMTRRPGASGSTEVVGTTTADLAITFGILVSLALLQLMQLVRCWTSNWARAAVACAYARKEKENRMRLEEIIDKLSGWMRLKVFVATSTNLFDKYLWQDKISQYSILPEPRLWTGGKIKGEWISSSEIEGERIFSSEIDEPEEWIWSPQTKGLPKCRRCVKLVQTLGLQYIWQVIWELLSSDTNKRGGVKLDEDVKGSVIEFLGQIQSDRLDRNWLSSLPDEPEIRHFLPHFNDPLFLTKPGVHCHRYTSCVMTWHIVTWYCELAEQKKRQEDALMSKAEAPIGGGGGGKPRDHRHVANALSQYCVYLVKSAPELLPGPVAWTKRVYDRFAQEVKRGFDRDTILANMSDRILCIDWYSKDANFILTPDYRTQNCQALSKLLMRRPDEIWKTLALVWVQLLVYAAPYGNVEAHVRRLSQGGEFITHLWALLNHLDIREWKVQGNLVKITTTEDAERVLTEDSQAVVAYLQSQYDSYHDELATASRLEDGVRYYYTTDYHVAELFTIKRYKPLVVVFLTKEVSNHKFTLYDGDYRAYDIARFVNENKIALAHGQAQEQSSEDDGEQSDASIEEEIQPLP